jgi:hypothetical protein
MTIRIENPKGAVRRGHNSTTGEDWETELKNHYGYIQRVDLGDKSVRPRGRDKDHVDVFIGPYPDSEIVFVVDQETPSGRFDEHKCMLGWRSKEAAREAYLSNYQRGWRGDGAVTPMTMEQFKRWLIDGDATKRAGPQVTAKYAKREEPPVNAPRGQGIPQDDDDAAINAAAGEPVSPPSAGSITDDSGTIPQKIIDEFASSADGLSTVPDANGVIGHIGENVVKARNFDVFKAKDNMNVVEGANHERWPDIVPDGELWVDENIDPHDWKPIGFHEAIEDYAMAELGMEYDPAHDIADNLEHKYRDPNEPERHVDEDSDKTNDRHEPPASEEENELCAQCGHDPCVCHVITPDWMDEANREIGELALV